MNKGFFLVVALLALIVAAIFLPALYFVTHNESSWSVREKKKTVAFQMAEQGLDRGVWKLQESDDVWNMVSTGTEITGYHWDSVYRSTDTANASEGEYKIKLTTGADGSGYVTIQSIGRDKSTDEVRAVEAEYSKIPIQGGLQTRGALQYKPGLIVHWGPVVDFTNITQSPSTYYPRKICKGYITGRDTDPNTPNGHDFFLAWPNPATYDYNSYQTKLGNPPTIDLSSYKTIAKNSSVPQMPPYTGNQGSAQTSSPTGSGFYTGDVTVNKVGSGGSSSQYAYTLNCPTCVIYIQGKAQFQNTTSQMNVRALIVESDFNPNGNTGQPDIVVQIPAHADREYYHPTALPTWTSNFASTGTGGNYYVKNARVRGYVYVGGDMSNSGGTDPVFIGILDIAGTMSANNVDVYYDATISTSVLALNMKPQPIYWREVMLNW